MRPAAAFLIALLLCPSAVLASEVTTVILVRHAEKAAEPADDPPLSEEGVARARELARVLAGTPIGAIYTTQYRRTRQTAEPLAGALAIEPRVVTAGKSYAAGLAARILEEHRGGTVLVVGHSNTTGDVLRHLGVDDPPPIADEQYDDLFVCSVAGGTAKLVSLRYGGASR
ncbi:MAG TPA: phosphoglycerate mutase family protein [Thermoanaerobaculia bacterium]|nr:phosphoglycerate mutase family protein [Thermoanaerobaculia bacterium]